MSEGKEVVMASEERLIPIPGWSMGLPVESFGQCPQAESRVGPGLLVLSTVTNRALVASWTVGKPLREGKGVVRAYGYYT